MNLEEEKIKLLSLTLKRKDSLKNHYFRDRPLLDEFINSQKKLVTALEQLEQAREALEHVTNCGEPRPASCENGGFEAAMILEALKQQEVGNE